MEFRVEIEGLKGIGQRSAEIQAAVQKEIKKALYSSAQEVANEAKRSIKGGGKSGRIYTHYLFTKNGRIMIGRKRDEPHQASAPGEAPATDSGRLVNSIIARMNTVSGEEAFVYIPKSTVKYATLLEFGTSKMAPRPFLFPAFERKKQWIRDRLNEGVRRGIAAASKK